MRFGSSSSQSIDLFDNWVLRTRPIFLRQKSAPRHFKAARIFFADIPHFASFLWTGIFGKAQSLEKRTRHFTIFLKRRSFFCLSDFFSGGFFQSFSRTEPKILLSIISSISCLSTRSAWIVSIELSFLSIFKGYRSLYGSISK